MSSLGRLCKEFLGYSYFWPVGGGFKLTKGSHVGNFDPVIASEWTLPAVGRGRGLSGSWTPAQVVFQVDKVQSLYRYKAVFAEQDASAAQMAAANFLDIICKA